MTHQLHARPSDTRPIAMDAIVQTDGDVRLSSTMAAEIKGIGRHLLAELPDEHRLDGWKDDDPVDLLRRLADGVVHCRFLEHVFPGSIPSARVNAHPTNRFEMGENQRVYLDAVRSTAVVINVDENDLVDSCHHPSLVLGLLWQIVHVQMRSRTMHRLTAGDEGEDGGGAAISNQDHKRLVMEWVNKRLASQATITNLGDDLSDSKAYLSLLSGCCPATTVADPDDGTRERRLSRASVVLFAAKSIGLKPILTADDIVNGNEMLNFTFVQSLVVVLEDPKGVVNPGAITDAGADPQKVSTLSLNQRRRLTDNPKVSLETPGAVPGDGSYSRSMPLIAILVFGVCLLFAYHIEQRQIDTFASQVVNKGGALIRTQGVVVAKRMADRAAAHLFEVLVPVADHVKSIVAQTAPPAPPLDYAELTIVIGVIVAALAAFVAYDIATSNHESHRSRRVRHHRVQRQPEPLSPVTQ